MTINNTSFKKEIYIENKKTNFLNNTNTIKEKNTFNTDSLKIDSLNSKVKNLELFSDNENLTEIDKSFSKIENASTIEEKFDLIVNVLKKNNSTIDLKSENRNIVSFRNPNLPSENDKKGFYDDVTYVFWMDKSGNKKVERFVSNTDPNGLFTDDRPKGDFGRIVAGKTYKYSFSTSTYLGDVLRPIGKLNIERFDVKENKFKPAQTTFATDATFLFHSGLSIYKDTPKYNLNTFSMGCQTFPKIVEKNNISDEWTRLWDTLNGNNTKIRQKEINYTILELSKK